MKTKTITATNNITTTTLPPLPTTTTTICPIHPYSHPQASMGDTLVTGNLSLTGKRIIKLILCHHSDAWKLNEAVSDSQDGVLVCVCVTIAVFLKDGEEICPYRVKFCLSELFDTIFRFSITR